MNRLLLVLAFSLASLLSGPWAAAQETGTQWYISGLGSYVDDDEDRNADDGLSGGQLALGIPFRRAWHIELFALYNEFNADGFDNDQEQTGLGAGVIRWFQPDAIISPYVAVAAGYSDTERDRGISESGLMTSGALGLLLKFGDRFGWRSEARYRRVLEDFALSDVYLSSGLQWTFGTARSETPGRRIRNDSDGDGVADAYDLCPDSASAMVDARGCPEADNDRDGVTNRLDRCPRTPNNIPVNSRGCPADSDRDGVIDALDACRGTAWEAVVDERGCPQVRDADGDGVSDDADRCADTPAGIRVDSSGCPVPERITLEGVSFNVNSSQLTAASEDALNSAAAVLISRPGLQAEIAGHTDAQGEAEYNLWLSQRRAEAVRQYLIGQGVDAARLTARGYGESEPLADNATAAGRRQNRRVELRLGGQ